MTIISNILKTGTLALIAGGIAVSAAQADEIYSCIGDHSALHFVIYEDGNTPRGGHMYLHGIQTAVLDAYRVNNISIRATIKGNTTNTELVLNKSRKAVYVELRDTSRKLCDVRYMDPDQRSSNRTINLGSDSQVVNFIQPGQSIDLVVGND